MTKEQFEALRGRKPQILGHEFYYKTAVLLPLVDYNGETCILFEIRSNELKNQPGEICFPGGGIESSDKGPAEAAVRETCEELGLNRENIDLLSELDILISPFNVVVYPHVGFIDDFSRIQPNYSEVKDVFYVPLKFFLNNEPIYKTMSVQFKAPKDYPYDLIPQGKDYPFREGIYPQHFYIWQGHVIWGLTARILNHFIDLYKQSQK